MPRGFVNLDGDFQQVAEFIGSGQAFANTVQTKYYIDDVLRVAHSVATRQFDIDIAAVAAATKSLSHMYEWGTAGINPAPDTPRLSPTSARAKLWRHHLGGGQGATKSIDFEFKPSLMPVPLPTPRTIGVKSSNINRFPTRRHTFAARPWITEYGTTVTVKPKYSQVLFIPLRNDPQTNDTRAIDNNYIMTRHAVRLTPGKELAGNFSTYWVSWWNKEGGRIMNETIEQTAQADLRTVVRASGLRTAARQYRRGARSKSFSLQVSTARAEANAEFRAKIAGRNRLANLQHNIEALHGGTA